MTPEPPMTEQINNLKKTVLEPMVPGMAAAPATAPASTVQSGNTCPQCGFPLRPGSEKCPKCGKVLAGSAQSEMVRRATVLNVPPAAAPAQNGSDHVKGVSFKNMSGNMKTVNPFLDGFEAVSACSLTPMRRSNERHELQTQEFEGETVNLNRANTDPDNVTIATDKQAVITKEGDRWYIEDKSEARTTFVRAGEKVEIGDGTIILLGNRLFEFHVQ